MRGFPRCFLVRGSRSGPRPRILGLRRHRERQSDRECRPLQSTLVCYERHARSPFPTCGGRWPAAARPTATRL
ncbi:hypothetical protein LF41_2996 [Lysobacter dokdonensis DS-58]|uniref:Uncharacterized protein n=1 Tax=Lysobacter dokdonensis DS-58 TaxID=1300345 RepID=A0A0A2WGN2_9GAMM|nr:hypothetical protein LF41_2996 [Lysobacter dokdonensis DS-58]